MGFEYRQGDESEDPGNGGLPAVSFGRPPKLRKRWRALWNVLLGQPTVFGIHLHSGEEAALLVATEHNTPKTYIASCLVSPKPEGY